MACHLQGWTARWLVESLSKHFTHFHTASEVYLGKSLCQCSTWKKIAHKVIARARFSTSPAGVSELGLKHQPLRREGTEWLDTGKAARKRLKKSPTEFDFLQHTLNIFEYHWMPKSYDKFTLDYGWRARLLCHVWRTIDRSFAVFAQMALWGSQPLITRTCMELSWSQEWPASLLSFSQMYRV